MLIILSLCREKKDKFKIIHPTIVMKNLNLEIINRITCNLGSKKNAVDYLMTLLCIGKESAYRRMNDIIPFTFHEVATISNNLNFSVDELLNKDIHTRVSFEMPVDITQNPEHIFIDRLEKSIVILKELAEAKEINIIAAMNRIPLFLLPFKTLFKFEYYLYLNSIGHIPLMTKFSDIVITQQIQELHDQATFYFDRLKNVTCVVDNNFFEGIMQEILYFFDLKLIPEEDLRSIQKELLDIFAFCEVLLRTGKNEQGSEYSIYYSFFNIGSNCVYYEYDNKQMLQLWIYPESPVVINNNELMGGIQKRWLESTIRRSILISKTNNILQIPKFEEAFMKILSLTKNIN